MNRRRVAQLDPLENRTLLSIVAIGKPAADVHVLGSHRHRFVVLGSLSGTFSVGSSSSSYAGNGTISALGGLVSGEAILTGTVKPAVFLFTGSMTLSNSSGSVTLSLSAHHPKHQTANLPPAQAVISGGTGAYVGINGLGTVNISISPDDSGTGGSFKATVHLNASL
jgi:hypothetical protein